VTRDRPTVVHLTTVDMSLALLLLPQLIAFQEAGYRIVGVSAPGPYVPVLEEHGVEHVALGRSTRAVDPRADVATAVDFFRLCRKLHPALVHTHNPKPGIYGRIGARLAGVGHVVNTVHGLYAQPTDRWQKRTVVYGLERVAAAFSDAELVQNPEDLPVLRRLRVPEHKLHLLGNGVDLERFDPTMHAHVRTSIRRELGIGDDHVVVGFVGRLVREKGYLEAFEAVQQLRGVHPPPTFVVAGSHEPDKADALTPAEVQAAADAGVRFLGMRHDVERLYAAMDVYVLASHREGFPRSAMEAAAMGLPIVATDIRGCRQAVDHGRTGLLVPAGDPTALAAAVAALATDAEFRSRLGAGSRAKALAEFDHRRQIAITLAIYDALLDRAQS
jgi:glycosyltransferase involved in cell wall biosynthesis